MDNGNYEWMAGASPSTATGTAENNNPPLTSTLTANRGSTEDLSEYTDADESVSSAPTEFLAEFLSAVMMKEYETALKYCKLILQYEPNNVAAKEFYPLILEKIRLAQEQEDSDESSSTSSSSSAGSRSGGGGSSEDATTASYSSLEDEEADIGNGNRPPRPKTPVGSSGVKQKSTASTSAAAAVASSDSESPTEPISQKLAGVN